MGLVAVEIQELWGGDLGCRILGEWKLQLLAVVVVGLTTGVVDRSQTWFVTWSMYRRVWGDVQVPGFQPTLGLHVEPWRGLGNLKRRGEEIKEYIAFPFSNSPLSNSLIFLGYFRNRIKVLPHKLCSQEFTALVGCEVLGLPHNYFDVSWRQSAFETFIECQSDTFDKIDKVSPPSPNLWVAVCSVAILLTCNPPIL